MPLLFWLLPFILAAGVLWVVAHQLAPIGRSISFSRIVFATVVMALCDFASHTWLKPLIGDWHLLLFVIVSMFIVLAVLRLPFWRSVLALLAYGITLGAAQMLVEWLMRYDKHT